MEEPARTWKEETTAATAGVDGEEKDVKSVRAVTLIIFFCFIVCIPFKDFDSLDEEKSATVCARNIT